MFTPRIESLSKGARNACIYITSASPRFSKEPHHDIINQTVNFLTMKFSFFFLKSFPLSFIRDVQIWICYFPYKMNLFISEAKGPWGLKEREAVFERVWREERGGRNVVTKL